MAAIPPEKETKMWYVIPCNKTIAEHLSTQPKAFEGFGEACAKAQFLREQTKNQYHVIKVQIAWTTQTIAEAMAE